VSLLGLSEYRRTRVPGPVSIESDLARELIVNGTFDSDVSGWTATSPATIAWNAGTLRVSRVSAAYGVDMCYQDVAVVAGNWYALKFDYVYENTGSTTMDVSVSFDGGTTDSVVTVVTGLRNNVTAIFQATSDLVRIIFSPTTNNTAICGIDNVSLRRVIYQG